MFIDYKITEALSELCVVSYSVTEQQSRLYSKFMAERDPVWYDTLMFNAAAATSAAPLYWDLKWTEPNPVTYPGKKEVLIDGGTIQNNPAIYAEQLAMQISEKERAKDPSAKPRPVRLLSVGTGGSPENNQFAADDAEAQSAGGDMSVMDWLIQFGYLSMTIP